MSESKDVDNRPTATEIYHRAARIKQGPVELSNMVDGIDDPNKGNLWNEISETIPNIDSVLWYFRGQKDLEETQTKESLNADAAFKKLAIRTIKILGAGRGCEYDKLYVVMREHHPQHDVKRAVNGLLCDGVCYEPRPGQIAVL